MPGGGHVIENFDEDVHNYDFSNLESSLTLAYRVTAGGDLNFAYPQRFIVYWARYYWEPAPEGGTALPEG